MEELINRRFASFIDPIASLLAQACATIPIPEWWEALGLPVGQFVLLKTPATWKFWIQEAVLHSAEQKLIEQRNEVSFLQGLAFCPLMAPKGPNSARTYGSMILSSLSFVLPLGLVGQIGAWAAQQTGAQSTDPEARLLTTEGAAWSLAYKERAAPEVALAIEVRGTNLSHMQQRQQDLLALEGLLQQHLISLEGLSLLHLPNPATPQGSKIILFPKYNVPHLETGGPDWVLRFTEALSAAEQAIHHPLPPPSLLLPKLEQVEKWIAQIRLGPKGEDTLKLPAVSHHYLQWVRNGALKDKFREVQMTARKEGDHRRKASMGKGQNTSSWATWSTPSAESPSWRAEMAPESRTWGSWEEASSSSQGWENRGEARWTWQEK
jgi:hypothetical protein